MPRLITHRSIRPVLLTVFALLVVCPPAQAAFPGANGKIAFSSNRDGNYEIYTMNPDRTGLTNITNNDPANDYEPAWSPDGTKIAFGSQVGNYTDIYTMNADGTGQTNITNNDPVNDREPAWSPDGNKIAFQSDRDGNWEIYTMNADGSGVARLTTDEREDWSPSWSPDGSKIAFSSIRDGDLEIYTMSPDGSGVVQLTSNAAHDRQPNWSPSGTKIAFSSDRDGNSFIYAMNADGSGAVRLTNSSGTLGDTLGDDLPAWSPDGAKIAFDGFRRAATPPFNFNPDIYTMNADGTGLGNFSNNPVRDSGADWQPIPYTGYARPKAASPINAALVIAYRECTAPNREHGPPLAHPSCSPPVQESDWLTTGTTDSNGQATQFTGSARFRTVVGDPATPADESDVTTVLNIADVRNKADLTDYTGEVEASVMLRITDRFSAVAPGGGSDPATMVDIPFPVRASCAATADPAVGGTCAVSSSIDAVVPGAVKERQRAIWEVGAIQVYDGGADGINSTQPNTLFARQGVFVP